MDIELKDGERIDDLEYKGLKIIQNKDGFCFGVDSVLISDFAKNVRKGSTVLDLGTGTGIISILLSKKQENLKIYGIEIQSDVAEMAERSVKLNGLENEIKIINDNLKNLENHFELNSIDAVVTNPPYKKNNTGLKSDDYRNLVSRHEIECTLEDIIVISKKLLKDKGEIYMINRAERLVDIITLMRNNKLEPKEIRFVHSKQNEKPTLVLVKAVKNAGEFLKIEKPLVIYNENGEYTDEILEIYNKK